MNDIFDFVLDEATAGRPTILPLYGGADKPLEAMTDEDLDQASEEVYAKVREQAFSRGLPVIIKRNGLLMREFPNGNVEPFV